MRGELPGEQGAVAFLDRVEVDVHNQADHKVLVDSY